MEDISLSDWDRILTGDVPAIFLVEIIIRAFVLYLLLMTALRLMGKRMANRMTRNELAAVATLSAAIGMPMQTPDRGLLPTVVIVALVVAVQRGLARRAARNRRFEKRFLGTLSILAEDGVLDTKQMREALISRDRVLSVLRSESIIHLGEVKRLYLEETGSLSVLKASEPQPGLSVLPEWDEAFIHEHHLHHHIPVCTYCGLRAEGNKGACRACGNEGTTAALGERQGA